MERRIIVLSFGLPGVGQEYRSTPGGRAIQQVDQLRELEEVEKGCQKDRGACWIEKKQAPNHRSDLAPETDYYRLRRILPMY